MDNSQRWTKHQLEKQYNISPSFDFAARKGYQESIGKKSSNSPCNTSLEGIILVDNDVAINNQTSDCGEMLESTLTRISNEEKGLRLPLGDLEIFLINENIKESNFSDILSEQQSFCHPQSY
ncbi:MAG: hypothetical protein EZS28_044020 [Streblomastix strix]|uniref:Uncharacterized protein n=1 Tax=Streblomastix strix TaxID=222440 RepID=A0A5J4TPT2_9EUKA|nr:MAG: hypothetical protein EZS28_044020 [Streblomastix strix]